MSARVWQRCKKGQHPIQSTIRHKDGAAAKATAAAVKELLFSYDHHRAPQFATAAAVVAVLRCTSKVSPISIMGILIAPPSSVAFFCLPCGGMQAGAEAWLTACRDQRNLKETDRNFCAKRTLPSVERGVRSAPCLSHMCSLEGAPEAILGVCIFDAAPCVKCVCAVCSFIQFPDVRYIFNGLRFVL